jgi:nucleoid-associated protein YgaU
VNRALLLGGIGGTIVAAALVLTFFTDKGHQAELAAVVGSPPPAASGTTADRPPDGTPAPDAAAAPAKRPETPTPPRFDVVRVNPRGDAVIAGRAAPDAQVTVREGEREVGKAKADARGEWVVVPRQPLPSGSRELTLTAQAPRGDVVQSEQNVVVVVPKRTSGADNSAARPLAVLVPRDGSGESVVVQRSGDSEPARTAATADVADPAAAREPETDERTRPLAIEAVDYDEEGHVIISGTAEPDARLHVYIENRFAGAGVADGSGRWRLVPGGALEPGLHTLRVDHVGDDGRVGSRVETRFTRMQPAEAAPPGNSVVFVEPGNSLWRIARRVYGAGVRYSVIYNANREQIRDPDLIYPGQVFFVPHVN